MTQPDSSAPAKRAAALAAVAQVQGGMLVGLGTGSTAFFAIEALAQAVREGLRVKAVATSRRTAQQAARGGIELLDLADVARIDLCIDGVDEIDPQLRAIKGAGGAMLREKIVARMADRMIAIADGSKAVERLGAQPVPVEVLPLARSFAARALTDLGAEPVLRLDDKGAPVATDQGNIILDCHFGTGADWAALATEMQAIAGVMGHGLFLSEVDELCMGTADGVICTQRRAGG
jgi:ribose 5-phosphate isomerase A